MPGAPTAKSRTGLWIVLGVILFAFVGCGVFGVYVVNKADETIDETIDNLATTIPDGTTVAGDTPTTESDDFESIFGGTEDGLADVVSCTRLDEDRLQVEMVNNSDQQSDYGLTIILEDTPGQRLADTIGFVEDLRPGERTLEEVFVFDAEGANCTVTAADRYPVDVDTAALAEVSACTVKEEDSLGSLVAEVSVANGGQVNYDYSVTVAVLNAEGVRQGSGYALIETVRPGETAPGDVYTSITAGDGFTCEAVSVDRTES